uniref:Uncharacterized protein n=1 Tax=Rhizophora mucronata TaxID=61149 RepID=A0A2P2NBS9_RHIMU
MILFIQFGVPFQSFCVHDLMAVSYKQDWIIYA